MNQIATESATLKLMSSPFVGSFNSGQQQVVALRDFLHRYVLAKRDTDAVANFVCRNPESPCRYCVPDDAIPVMMRLLNECFRLNIPNQILECQYVNNVKASSLLLDFVLETDHEDIAFDTVVTKICEFVFGQVLQRYFTMPQAASQYHVIFTATRNAVYPTPRNLYQSRFRLLFPGILLEPDAKMFVYQRIWQSKQMKILFEERLDYGLRQCFCTSMRMEPVTMLGSFQLPDTEPMEVRQVLLISSNKRSDGWELETTILSNASSVFRNIVSEASINYMATEAPVINKRQLLLNEAGICKNEADFRTVPRLYFTSEYEAAQCELAMLSVYDNEARLLYEILKIIGKERFASKEGWGEIVRSIAAAPINYRCLAVIITYERAKRVVIDGTARAITLDEFQAEWKLAQSMRGKYSHQSLRYWAAMDNGTQMHRFISSELKRMITQDVSHSVYQARLKPFHFAKYLRFMLGHLYMTQNDDGIHHNWFEFVVDETEDKEHGQIFKWRNIGSDPDSLCRFMMEELQPVMEIVFNQLKAWVNEAYQTFKADDPRIAYVKGLLNKFDREIMVLMDPKPKQLIVREAAGLFKNNTLIRRMDKTPNVIGVGNGVVEFDGAAERLLAYYHTYPISLYTDTNYIPYDPENPYIKTMHAMLRSLVPDDEEDALDFMLYFLSTSLDWHQKESLFLIVYGGGCHAIDTPIRMWDGSVRAVQDVVVGDWLVGDDHEPRIVSELFRGTSQMVRVSTSEGRSFEVNLDHVLSLKFGSLCECSVSGRRVEWFERNGGDEPITMHRILPNHNAAKQFAFRQKMLSAKVICKGDVIDVKVRDLLRWPAWWMSSLAMYKSDGTEHQFSISEAGVADYYGFQLNGNHRYLTDDGYVHHNSNGKSVFLELFRRTLGEMYARKMPLSFITDQGRTRSSNADPAIMELKNARLVYYSESDRNERVNIAKVKEITGGETLSGRALYKNQENFQANCNHIVTTNHRFVIETNEHAVWRRFLCYRFKLRFVEQIDPNEPLDRLKDPDLISRVTNDKRYHEAFLAILMHYHSRLYAEFGGRILRVPKATIDKETEEYRIQEDVFERFIVNNIIRQEGSVQAMKAIIDLFRRYHKANTNEPANVRTEDAIHIFRNSSIGKYIRNSSIGYVLQDFRVLEQDEQPTEDMTMLVNWRAQH